MFKSIKILVLLSMVFLYRNSVRAQAYKPMLAQFNEWHVTNCFSGCLTDVYFTDTDTIINGYTYSILDGYHYINRNFLLREDTVEKQVFLLATGIGKEDNEYLLYDFSLMPGDSMQIYNPVSPFPDSAGYFMVDSIVPTVQIDGQTYRHFYLTALDSVQSVSGRAEWIEGIGSLNLINTPGAYGDVNDAGALSCFFNNQTLHYSNLDSITGCIQVHPNLSIETGKDENFIISIFPNPASNQLFIDSYEEQVVEMQIFDLLGKEIVNYNFSHKNASHELDISFLNSGIFLLHFRTKTDLLFVEKLVVE